MDALDLLQNRTSMPRLDAPAPNAEELELIYRAALRAPDHGSLRPWRFLTIAGEGLKRLGELYLKAKLSEDAELDQAKQDKLLNMPLRAPMIIVVIAKCSEHPKVPEVEQQVAAGCAAQNILHAAYAQGYGAMWRTGEMAYNPVVKQGLGLAENEDLIGYIYIGSTSRNRPAPEHNLADYVSTWEG